MPSNETNRKIVTPLEMDYDFLKIEIFRWYWSNSCHLHSLHQSVFNDKFALKKLTKEWFVFPKWHITLLHHSALWTLNSDLYGVCRPSCLSIDSSPNYFVIALFFHLFLVACYATLHPALSVCPLVCHTLLFFCFCGLWPHCSCPSDQVTSNTATFHPHATWVAV